MEKKKEELFLSWFVLCTHEDSEVIEDVEVAYNGKFELVIRLSLTVYGWVAQDFLDRTCYIEAYATRNEAYYLSKKLGVSMVDLPRKIAGSVDPGLYEIALVDSDNTWQAFSEMISYISNKGCRYKIRYKDALTTRGKYNRWRA